MATWTQVLERVQRDFALDDVGEGRFALTLEHSQTETARAQRVMVRLYEAWGREMIEIRSAFGEVGSYAPEHLLAENLTIGVGAIAIHGRFLVLVHKAALPDLTVDGVVFLVTRIGLLADALEARSGLDRY